MPITTKEITFENEIEYALTQNGGYTKGNPADFDKAAGVDTALLFRFLQTSQPKEWSKLIRKYGESKAEQGFLRKITRDLEVFGTLALLRKGIVDSPAKFKLCFFQPASGMNQTDAENYAKNILSITRQVYYSQKNENSVDVVLFVNGLPVATMELKNAITGQTVENAKRQYKYDRDTREPLLTFKRGALVHFAVDTDEVYMTTRLQGADTYFLPFNKGNSGGKGNPREQRRRVPHFLPLECNTAKGQPVGYHPAVYPTRGKRNQREEEGNAYIPALSSAGRSTQIVRGCACTRHRCKLPDPAQRGERQEQFHRMAGTSPAKPA